MQGVTFLIIAYAIAWLGLFVYLAVVALRIRNVRTELAAETGENVVVRRFARFAVGE